MANGKIREDSKLWLVEEQERFSDRGVAINKYIADYCSVYCITYYYPPLYDLDA